MVKAVFTTKVEPSYDDLPEQRYHFPATYLNAVESTVGDWILYYEPRRTSADQSSRGGRQAYFATARVTGLEADPSRTGHFYAFVEHYLEFERAVPFREGQHYYESALRRSDGFTNRGAFGRAVRTLLDQEYDLIVQSGLAKILAEDEDRTAAQHGGFAEDPELYERPIISQIAARPFRDAAFAAAVKNAYRNTCALSGICLINGGGRAEVQAAHIRPVRDRGPDSVRNGLALSGTFHWMFDRGLVSVAEDHAVLIAKDRVPDTVARFLNPDGRLRLPDRPELHPHRKFLEFHRHHVFKG